MRQNKINHVLTYSNTQIIIEIIKQILTNIFSGNTDLTKKITYQEISRALVKKKKVYLFIYK